MCDTTPFLSDSDLKHSRPSSIGEAIERCIGDFNSTQLLQAILVSVAWFFDAQQTFISVFTDAQPAWHCTSSSCFDSIDGTNLCHLPEDAWSWDFPKHTSIISEWGLECASSLIKGLPASAFFMGCLAGGFILATLADSSFGRKNALSFSCLMMSLSCLLTAFSTNIWMYSVLRFINGFARATIGTCAIVLSTELVGKRWRGQVGSIGFFCFTLGFLSLPAVAYINRGSSWRTVYLYASVPTILYSVLVHFLVQESPRWLLIQGRKEEAVSVIKSISSLHDNIQTNVWLLLDDINEVSFRQETWSVDLYAAIKILAGKRWALRRLSAVMVTGFGVGIVYYGMPLGLANLSFNLYLSVTFNALSELPASLITFFLIGKLNRRASLIGFAVTSGLCSCALCAVVMREWAKSMEIGLELVAFFGACSAFNMLLIYTIELFPTCVRNSAISMVRQALVLGGAFSPVIVAASAGRPEKGLLPYGVFGLVIGVCGLVVIGLPETRDTQLSDTMDEEEYKSIATSAAGFNRFVC